MLKGEHTLKSKVAILSFYFLSTLPGRLLLPVIKETHAFLSFGEGALFLG